MLPDQDFKDFNYNVIGAKSFIKGEMIFYGDTIINSHIEGIVTVKEKGKLTLERGSFIKGKIQAIDLEIFGTVDGEIECSGILSIRSSAHVSGLVQSARLVVYPGAVVEIKAQSHPEL